MHNTQFCFFFIALLLCAAHGDNDTALTPTNSDISGNNAESDNDITHKAMEQAKKVVQSANTEIQDVFIAQKEKKSSDQNKKDKLLALFDTYIDARTVARMVWPGQKKDLRKHMDRYIQAFKQDLVDTYFNMLSGEYKHNVSLGIENVRIVQRSKNKKNITFRVNGVFKSEPPVNVCWLVLKNKIIDLRVEGASLVSAKKDDYRLIARKNCMTDGKVDGAKFVSILTEKHNTVPKPSEVKKTDSAA